MARVPFNKPYLVGNEMRYMRDAVDAMHVSGDGAFTHRCHSTLEAITGAHRALLTTSCTAALELAALLLEIEPGDEVIVPSFTFVSTANAFVLRGATPVFADVRPDTLNIDETRLEALITPRTRAVVVVHYAGVACEMTPILELAARRGIAVVEDNAHGLFGSYRGRPLGSFGVLATLSFHETKNVTCGEGGALLVNDRTFVPRAEILREKGTNRAAFFRGRVDKYTWVDIGSSYLPSDLLAAFLWAQLEARDSIQAQRMATWNRYAEALAPWAAAQGVQLPVVPAHCQHPAHLFYLVMPTAEDRDAMIAHLAAADVSSVFHYVPLHASPMGRRTGAADCPVADRVGACLLRLPMYAGLPAALQDRVIEAVTSYVVRSQLPVADR
jgi:dTDP-4-amino-4,6-dideoxygalactose transaminase